MMKIYVIPNLKEIDKWVSLSKDNDLGFEYNEFYNPHLLDDEKLLNELINKYDILNRNNDTLHGVFFDINFASNDPLIKEISIKRAKTSLLIARKLRCKGVIFHTNYETWIKSKAYKDCWINESCKVYKQLLNEFNDIDIYVENMFDDDPYMLKELANKLKDEQNFGICLDVGHAYISNTSLDVWFKELMPFIKHIHFNDNDKYNDSHLPIGKGSIDYKYVINMISKMDDVSVLLEMNNYEDVIISLDMIKDVII